MLRNDGFRSVRVGILRGTAGGGEVSGQAALHFRYSAAHCWGQRPAQTAQPAWRARFTRSCMRGRLRAAGLNAVAGGVWRRRYPHILFRAANAQPVFGTYSVIFQAHVDAMLCETGTSSQCSPALTRAVSLLTARASSLLLAEYFQIERDVPSLPVSSTLRACFSARRSRIESAQERVTPAAHVVDCFRA